jgi:hypothetical protein
LSTALPKQLPCQPPSQPTTLSTALPTACPPNCLVNRSTPCQPSILSTIRLVNCFHPSCRPFCLKPTIYLTNSPSVRPIHGSSCRRAIRLAVHPAIHPPCLEPPSQLLYPNNRLVNVCPAEPQLTVLLTARSTARPTQFLPSALSTALPKQPPCQCMPC